MNSSNINWRKFTLRLSSAVIQKIEPLTNEKRRNVLIIDDSLFDRTRSKKVELLAKVFDHVSHKYTRGFRMLTLGWSDGNSFLPLSQCLLSSAERENRLQEASSDIDARSNCGNLRKLAQTKATSVMLTLLKDAKAAEIPAKYVLFDTWFCSPSSLLQVKDIGYYVIGMVKNSFSLQRMDAKRTCNFPSSKEAPWPFPISSFRGGGSRKRKTSLPVKLVFVRNRNKRQDYLIWVSTDVNLSEEEIIQTYGKRWNIEVFFKMCKSYLKLGKESRTMSYDAMTAHVSIVLARYMLLSLEQRRKVDKRSIGELFYISCDELQEWLSRFSAFSCGLF